jgi:hypothetical protein
MWDFQGGGWWKEKLPTTKDFQFSPLLGALVVAPGNHRLMVLQALVVGYVGGAMGMSHHSKTRRR